MYKPKTAVNLRSYRRLLLEDLFGPFLKRPDVREFSFDDFVKKMEKDTAAGFEIPVGLLRLERPAFADAKKGDKVFAIDLGWGEVVQITDENMLVVKFGEYDKGTSLYELDGREDPDDVNPLLYWGEVNIDAPTRPAKTVTKYKIKYQQSGSFRCVTSGGHYKDVGDFRTLQPGATFVCACIVESTAKDFPA